MQLVYAFQNVSSFCYPYEMCRLDVLMIYNCKMRKLQQIG